MLHARGERHARKRPLEPPVLGRRRAVAHDLDLPRVRTAEPGIVGESEIADPERVEPHELRRHRVDRHLVRARENHVLDVRHHAPRPRPVAREGAVHHGEHAPVDRLLDAQQIHERLVDDRVRPVPVLVEQAAEGVLHRPGRGGEDVRLDRRQVHDVRPQKAPRDREALGVDVVQHEELLRQIAHRLADVHPRLARLVDVHVAQPVRLDHPPLLVLALAEPGVDHHRPVVARVDPRPVVAVGEHGSNDAVELPRGRRARRKEEVPGDVDLERRVRLARHDRLVAGQVHELVVVGQHRLGRRPQHGDARAASRHGLAPNR